MLEKASGAGVTYVVGALVVIFMSSAFWFLLIIIFLNICIYLIFNFKPLRWGLGPLFPFSGRGCWAQKTKRFIRAGLFNVSV